MACIVQAPYSVAYLTKQVPQLIDHTFQVTPNPQRTIGYKRIHFLMRRRAGGLGK